MHLLIWDRTSADEWAPISDSVGVRGAPAARICPATGASDQGRERVIGGQRALDMRLEKLRVILGCAGNECSLVL